MAPSIQRGYVMFEVLISVLVISVGFVALTGAQVRGLAASNDSLFRSKAVYLTYQMADRVRANIAGASAGNYNAFTAPVSDPGCVEVNCSVAPMAATDYAEWSAEVAALLPSGHGVICIDGTPEDGSSANAECDGVGNTLVVKVWWKEGSDEHGFATAFRP